MPPSESRLKEAEKIARKRAQAGEEYADGAEEIFNMHQNDPEYRRVKDTVFREEKERMKNSPKC